MNIIRENIDALNAVLKVKVSEADYAEKVDAALKNARKRASVPGFRPGMVPASLVKKMYGKSILVDEINKLLNDSINHYIVENKVDVLGQPLPKADSEQSIDWDGQKEFEFTYDMAVAPDFALEFSGADKIDYLKIVVDNKAIDEAINNIARRQGKVEYPEQVENEDMVFVAVHETEGGATKEGGYHKTAVLSLEQVKNQQLKDLFLGKKKEDTLAIDVAAFAQLDAEAVRVVKEILDNPELAGKSFEIKINNISRVMPAEINQEFYDKVYGPGVTEGVEAFRAKVKEELEQAYKAESDRHFKHEVNHLLTAKFNLSLPDNFLKRWIKAVNDKPLTDEQLDLEYPGYAESLKLQLIENKIIRENDIKVGREEAEEYTYKLIEENFKRYGQFGDDDQIKETVNRVLSNEEEAKRIFQKLYDDKLVTYYESKLGVSYKEISPEEFNTTVEAHYAKHHHH